jgi:hypothetical protein
MALFLFCSSSFSPHIILFTVYFSHNQAAIASSETKVAVAGVNRNLLYHGWKAVFPL